MKKVCGFILLCLCLGSNAQDKILKHELQVEADNDAYTLNLTRDQYYSQGVALRYRLLVDSTLHKKHISKKIRSYELNHRIYTPKRLYWTQVEELDRPYAGQLTAAVSNEYYYKSNSYFKLKLELGWMGPALRTAELQYGWHQAFGFQLPRAWQYEINNGPIVDAYFTYAKTLAGKEGLDIISESNIAIGTTFSFARQELMFRLGTIKPINQSTQFNAIPGIVKKKSGIQEFYFFISPGVEYIAYNATIEGQLIGKDSFYTETRVPWLYQTRAGIMTSWNKFDLAFILYRRTKETTESTYHKYVGIRMNLRF